MYILCFLNLYQHSLQKHFIFIQGGDCTTQDYCRIIGLQKYSFMLCLKLILLYYIPKRCLKSTKTMLHHIILTSSIHKSITQSWRIYNCSAVVVRLYCALHNMLNFITKYFLLFIFGVKRFYIIGI